MSGRSLFILIALLIFSASCNGEVREPEVAGAFYPADANTLKTMVRDFLKSVTPASKGTVSPQGVIDPPEGGSASSSAGVRNHLIALISPHAGYEFSGHVAAYGYKEIEGSDIRTVILIGSSHYHSFMGASIYTKGSFKTPLGNIKIDKKTAEGLLNESAHVGFYPNVYEKEHSIEVQLPFLQSTLKDFKIVPILMGSPTRESFEHLSARLIEIMSEDKHAILIASTDLSHFHGYDTAMRMDGKIIDAIERISIKDVESLLMHGESEMCGAYPVILTMKVAGAVGATQGVLYKYANSGDVTSEKGRVVGYASMGLYKSPLTKQEREELLGLAKKAITEYVTTGKIIEAEIKSPRLRADGAVFVTITRNGQLRGCIGNIQPVMPLYQSVLRNAIAACSMDSRFAPMKKEELQDMDVEVSILTPLELLKDVKGIAIGRDGLYIIKDGMAGILLPQVPVQFGWDRETFLRQVSLKAGLPEDAWKNGAILYRFRAEVIRGH